MADVPINYAGKFRGWNITTPPGDASIGDLWFNWDWIGWIRPQIDLAMSLGATGIRLIGDVQVVNLGRLPQAAYNAQLQTIVKYCFDNGLAYYYTGCATYGTGGVDNGTSALANSTIANIISANIGAVTGVSGAPDYSASIIGCDIIQEASAAMTAAQCNAIYALVKPNVKSPIGCTFSDYNGIPSDTWLPTIINSCDYLDLHVYPQIYGITTQPTPSQVTSGPRTSFPTKDIIFGEGGADFSAYTSSQVTSWYAGLASLQNMADTHVRGSLFWAVYDQQAATQLYGAFDSTGAPRANMVLPFIQGLSGSATLLAPTRLRVVNNRLVWDPTGCTNAWASTKLYRDGSQIGNPVNCYFDDSANWRGAAHSYTVTALDASNESAQSNVFVYPLSQVARKNVAPLLR